MEFKSTFWAIIVFSMVIVASGVILDERGAKYNSPVESDLNEDYDRINEMANVVSKQKGNINPQSPETSSDSEAETFRGAYGIVTGMPGALDSVTRRGGIIRSLETRYTIPPYIIIGLITIIIFSVVLGIVAVVFRLGRTSA